MVFATSYPLAAAVGGWLVKKDTGVPLVVEFRDPWTSSPVRLWPTKLHYLAERWLEGKVVASADAIIMNTPTARRNLLEQYPLLDPSKVHVISHGYDADRFERSACCQPKRKERLVIGYLGNFYSRGKRLDGTTERRSLLDRFSGAVRYSSAKNARNGALDSSPRTLLRAVSRLTREKPALRDTLELRFIGSRCPGLTRYAEELGIAANVRATPRVPPEQVASALGECDVLFLTNPPIEDSPFVGSKTVEYLIAGKPVLAELPSGDQARIIERTGVGVVCAPGDEDALANAIAAALGDGEKGIDASRDWNYIQLFKRDEQIKDLLQVLGQAWGELQPRPVISRPFLEEGAASR